LSCPTSVYPRLPRRLPKSLGFSRYALFFDGVDDYGQLPLNPSLLQAFTAITVEAWVRLEDSTRGAGTIVCRGSYDTGEFNLLKWPDNNFACFQCWDLSPRRVIGSINICDGRFHLVRGSFDGNNLILEVDNVLDNSVPVANTIASDTERTYIGARLGTEEFARGIIDEVHIYDRILSDSEKEHNFSDYHNPVRSGLILLLRMEEGTGLTTYDGSGLNNDCSLLPAADPPTWVENRKWELRAGAGV